MEAMKDLDVLIMESEKVGKIAKMLSRLPEILNAVKVAEVRMGELDRITKSLRSKADDAQKKLEAKNGEVAEAQAQLDKTLKSVDASKKELASTDAKVKAMFVQKTEEAQNILDKKLSQMADEEAKARSITDENIAQLQQAVREAEMDMESKLEEFNARIAKTEAKEKDAINRLRKAEEALADLKKKL